eukprot:PhF_6_TR12244/c0_g1_i2/m.19387
MDWLSGILWPFPNLYEMSLVSKSTPKPPIPAVTAGPLAADFKTHFITMTAGVRALLLAYVAMYYLFDGEDLQKPNPYPAFRPNVQLQLSWMLPILIRNVLATWLFCGFWDGLLYFTPFGRRLQNFKWNPTYPTTQQIMHDAFHSTSASCFGSAVEVALCYGWSHGYFPTFLWHSRLVTFIAGGCLVTYLRIPHFYAIHRAMHPWRTKHVYDLGKVLYRHVHSLHHKSYNPTAFSGTSMHPVESTGYYSAGVLPALAGLHPLCAIATIVDCAVGAWLGHDGFFSPGAGDYFHYLHHKLFDGNYGAGSPFMPLDEWFGTHLTCTDDLKKNWGAASKVGMEGNETKVHKEK